MSELGIVGKDMKLRRQAENLHRKAEMISGRLQSLAEGVAKQYGARVTPINLKSVGSIMRKAKGEQNGIKDIKDSYRTTIIADKNSIPKIIKSLSGSNKNGFKIERIKQQKLDTGYTGNIINFKDRRTGIVGEIQVNTPKMIYAKENYSIAYKILGGKTMRSIYKETKMPSGWGHALYEQSRTVSKYRRNNSENAKYSKLQNLQKAYYGKFQ